MDIYSRMDKWLGGTDFDTKYVEDVPQKKGDMEKNFFEGFSEMYNLFNEYELNESEVDNLDSLKIDEELYAIQEALESIKTKAVLSEDIGSMLAIAIPGIAFLTTALIKAYASSSGEIKTPTKVANAIHDVVQFVTNGKEKERTERLKAVLTRGNPDLDPKTIDRFVAKAKEEYKRPATSTSKDSRISGKGDTDFAAMNRERFKLNPAK